MAPKTSNRKLIDSLRALVAALPPQPWAILSQGHPVDYEDSLELIRVMDSSGGNIFESWPESQSILVARNGTGDNLVKLSKALPAAIEALEASEPETA